MIHATTWVHLENISWGKEASHKMAYVGCSIYMRYLEPENLLTQKVNGSLGSGEEKIQRDRLGVQDFFSGVTVNEGAVISFPE